MASDDDQHFSSLSSIEEVEEEEEQVETGVFRLDGIFLTGEVYWALQSLFPDRYDELFASIEKHIIERRKPHKCVNCRTMISWHLTYCDWLCEEESIRLREDPP